MNSMKFEEWTNLKTMNLTGSNCLIQKKSHEIVWDDNYPQYGDIPTLLEWGYQEYAHTGHLPIKLLYMVEFLHREIPMEETLQRYYTSEGWATVKVAHTTHYEWVGRSSDRFHTYHMEFLPVKGETPNFGQVKYHLAGTIGGFSMSPLTPLHTLDITVHIQGNCVDIISHCSQYGFPVGIHYRED